MSLSLSLAITNVGGGGGGGSPVTNSILVANRCQTPGLLFNAIDQVGVYREHYASPEGAITNLVFTDVNWYFNAAMAVTTSANSITFRKYVEYPAGVFTPVLYSGGTSATMGVLGQVTSDVLASVTIPAGAKWWEHTINITGSTVQYPAIELPAQSATLGLTDGKYNFTGTPTRGAADASVSHFGSAVITGTVSGTSSASAFGIMGDSIAWGQGDITSVGPKGGSGYLSRALDNKWPWFKVAVGGTTAVQMATNSGNAQWNSLLAKILVTDWINEYGGGDLRVGSSVAATETAFQTLYGMFGSARTGQTTVLPRTDSTDGYATVANQTPKTDGNWANEVTLNTDIRAGLPNVDYVLESSDRVSSAHNSRVWIAPPVPNIDGVHPNSYLANLTGGFFQYDTWGRSTVAPTAPLSIALIPGSITMQLTFSRPATGTNTVQFLIEYKRTIDSSWTTFLSGATLYDGTYTGLITGLTASTGYDVRVTPSNSAGTGPAASSSTTTTATFQPLDLGTSVLGMAWDTNSTSRVLASGANLTQMGELYTSNILTIGGAPTVITNGGQTGNKRVLAFPAGAFLAGYLYPALLDIPDGSTATSVFTVVEAMKYATGTSRGFLWGTAGSPNTKASIGQRGTVTNRGASAREVDARTALTAFQATVETTNYHIFTTIKNGTSVVFRVDGTQVASLTLVGDGTWNFTDFFIGSDPGTTVPGSTTTISPPANYSGLVIAKTALSGTDLTNVEAWVGATAGL
jgi:hypothetical protein